MLRRCQAQAAFRSPWDSQRGPASSSVVTRPCAGRGGTKVVAAAPRLKRALEPPRCPQKALICRTFAGYGAIGRVCLGFVTSGSAFVSLDRACDSRGGPPG